MGHPVLRIKARPVESRELKTAALQKLIDDMIDTMDEYSGIGLAAPQVHESLRVFVATLEGEDGAGEPMAIINPEITPVGKEIVEAWEGCLSIPDIRGRVPRSQRIVLRALSREGKRLEINAHDFPARVIQHETDHLDGVLFVDRLDRDSRRAAMRAIREAEWMGQAAPLVKRSPHPTLGRGM